MKNTTNKLRNTFLAASFCLLSTFSYGQTKEETINWLKEKLTSCLYLRDNYNNQLKFVNINECEFVVSYNNPQSNGSSSYHIFTVPTTDIVINDGLIQSKLKVIKHYKSWDSSTEYNSSLNGILIRECETDIYIRIQKALNHLTTFCPKKKETF